MTVADPIVDPSANAKGHPEEDPSANAKRAVFADLMVGRGNNFDFIRFALATFVVFSHSSHALNRGDHDLDPLLGLTWNQERLGNLAVNGFFAISGCLVTASWERSARALDYFRKRVLRIYPGFVVAWLVCILVVAPLSGLAWADYAANIRPGWWLLKIVLLRGFGDVYVFPNNPMHSLNTVLWSIPVEFACYILVAVVGALGILGRRRFILAMNAVVLAMVVLGP